jgi:GNAT superfamily N-acetyltransferase
LSAYLTEKSPSTNQSLSHTHILTHQYSLFASMTLQESPTRTSVACDDSEIVIRPIRVDEEDAVRALFATGMESVIPDTSDPMREVYLAYAAKSLQEDMADITHHYIAPPPPAPVNHRRNFWVAVLRPAATCHTANANDNDNAAGRTESIVGCVAVEPHRQNAGITPIDAHLLDDTNEHRAKSIAELRRMSVSPDFRGKRIATRLLEHLTAWCRANGFDTVRLTCSKPQQAAQRLYERFGFRLLASCDYDLSPYVQSCRASTMRPLVCLEYEYHLL